MYLVVEYEVDNRSKFCELDCRYRVAIRYASAEKYKAKEVAEKLAKKAGLMRVPPYKRAIVRYEDSPIMPDHKIAVLNVPEDRLTGVLACPIIRAHYVE